MFEITLTDTVRAKAIQAARTPGPQQCPYPEDSEQARVWKDTYTENCTREARIRQRLQAVRHNQQVRA